MNDLSLDFIKESGSEEQAVQRLVEGARKWEISFPYYRTFVPDPREVFIKLRQLVPKISHQRYYLWGYYPRYKLYLPPLFHGKSPNSADSSNMNEFFDQPFLLEYSRILDDEIDFLADFFMEDLRVRQSFKPPKFSNLPSSNKSQKSNIFQNNDILFTNPLIEEIILPPNEEFVDNLESKRFDFVPNSDLVNYTNTKPKKNRKWLSLLEAWSDPDISSIIFSRALRFPRLTLEGFRISLAITLHEQRAFRCSWSKWIFDILGHNYQKNTPTTKTFAKGSLHGLTILDLHPGWGERLTAALATDAHYISFEPDAIRRQAFSQIHSSFSGLSFGSVTLLPLSCKKAFFSPPDSLDKSKDKFKSNKQNLTKKNSTDGLFYTTKEKKFPVDIITLAIPSNSIVDGVPWIDQQDPNDSSQNINDIEDHASNSNTLTFSQKTNKNQIRPSSNLFQIQIPIHLQIVGTDILPIIYEAWKVLKNGGYMVLEISDIQSNPICECLNVFIEQVLPGSSFEGIIGTSFNSLRPHPVWIWRKILSHNEISDETLERRIWSPPSSKRYFGYLFPEVRNLITQQLLTDFLMNNLNSSYSNFENKNVFEFFNELKQKYPSIQKKGFSSIVSEDLYNQLVSILTDSSILDKFIIHLLSYWQIIQ